MTTENAQLARDPVTDNAIVLGAGNSRVHRIHDDARSSWARRLLLAAGGHNTGLTAWAEGCNLHPAGIEAAGPGLQFAAGLLAWLVLRLLSTDAARLRYFFWLY
jgi:hypothetical protein